MNPSGIYITGTDTGIGKTLVASTLLHAWRARGWRVAGLKPVASGCVQSTKGWRNDDALALQLASDPRPAYADVNPYALPLPLAPELAARAAGIEVTLPPIVEAYARLATQADVVVVEGVGGWAAPLSATLGQAEVVHALQVPVLLVVGLRLGCLNHAYLSARAIAADGCMLVGWIASDIDPAMAAAEDNIGLLSARLPAPCWGRLPYQATPDPAELANFLQLPGEAAA